MDRRIIDTINEICVSGLDNTYWLVERKGGVWSDEYFNADGAPILIMQPFICVWSENDGTYPIKLTDYDYKFTCKHDLSTVWVICFDK